MLSFGKTDIGKKRSMNQDNLFFSDEPVGSLPNLYIVADGMGGHKAGDYASSYAVYRFVEFAKQCEDVNPVTVMKKGIRIVNDGILAASREREELNGMGTTFVCAVVADNRLYVEKNIITRALGINEEAVPDFFEVELHMDERILLCSDGLSNMVEDDELLNIIVEAEKPKAAVERLIDRANYYGGKDNIAALVAVQ